MFKKFVLSNLIKLDILRHALKYTLQITEKVLTKAYNLKVLNCIQQILFRS